MKPLKYSDHFAIEVNMKMAITQGKKKGNKPVINYHNKEGWENYANISDKHAPRIVEAVRHASDSNAMQ